MILFVIISRGDVGRFVTFVHGGSLPVGVHKEVQEAIVRQLLSLIWVVAELALGEHNAGTVNVERHRSFRHARFWRAWNALRTS